MQIRYTDRAASFLRQVRRRNESEYHALNGIIIQLSMMPEIDGKTKILMDFGSGRNAPVYVDSNWWIVYRIDNVDSEFELVIISVWNAGNPPHASL